MDGYVGLGVGNAVARSTKALILYLFSILLFPKKVWLGRRSRYFPPEGCCDVTAVLLRKEG